MVASCLQVSESTSTIIATFELCFRVFKYDSECTFKEKGKRKKNQIQHQTFCLNYIMRLFGYKTKSAFDNFSIEKISIFPVEALISTLYTMYPNILFVAAIHVI